MLQINKLYDTGPGKITYAISFIRKNLGGLVGGGLFWCGLSFFWFGLVSLLNMYDWTMKISLLIVLFCINSSLLTMSIDSAC